MTSAWARLAAAVGDVEATRIIERKWGQPIPEELRIAGVMQKAKFAHLS